MVTLLRSKEVVTRKPHQCFGCLETFPKGERMEVATNVDGGEIYDLHFCLSCKRYMEDNPDIVSDNEGNCMEGCVREAKLTEEDYYDQPRG